MRAEDRFASAMHGQFLGEAPRLDLVKLTMLEKWKAWGNMHIANIPNLINEQTSIVNHVCFARIYIKLNLSQQLKKGFWVDN